MKIRIVCVLFLCIVSAASAKVYPQQHIKDFHLSNYKENGTRDWEINGTEATVYEKYVDIDKMDAKYYSNESMMQVKSDKAKIDKEDMSGSFRDNVEVKIPIDKSKDYTTVTCDGPLEMEYNKGQAVFYTNVIVENPNGKLYCDKATIFFDAAGKKLVKIVAEGNVKIVQAENTTYAERATYFADEKKIVLEGKPHLFYFPKENNANTRESNANKRE